MNGSSSASALTLAARARRRTDGRPPRLSVDQVRTARRLYEQQDMTVAQTGDVLGVSRTTVYRALRRESEPVAERRGKTSG
ncbi:helix-turn-helix domain-containing protein [Curtobacterium sp. MCSS17_008]|uniref:helix-turn-helix domain-containing protein n=1 Tax=Curtobacterium sp. MCSS17_008 TaxID=2175647 RepID=UPI002815DD21|nr:helix-turn-helix domain-containing protein [Curtobacterium sp. MCSS17_008]